MRIGHATDIHLNFLIHDRNRDMSPHSIVDSTPFKEFCKSIHDTNCEMVVITGDITEAPFIEQDLKYLHSFLQLPIYFVLGNHDFYHGSIFETKNRIKGFSNDAIKWLGATSDNSVIKLTEKSCLIGDDGWYDIRAGLGPSSRLFMNDAQLIAEFRFQPPIVYVAESRHLAEKSARRIDRLARKAIAEGFKNIYIATHVPPWHEASLSPQRQMSDGDWAPYMTCIILGDAITQFAAEHPEHNFTVLCGHTHTQHCVNILGNLECRVGQANYGDLMFDVLEIE